MISVKRFLVSLAILVLVAAGWGVLCTVLSLGPVWAPVGGGTLGGATLILLSRWYIER